MAVFLSMLYLLVGPGSGGGADGGSGGGRGTPEVFALELVLVR